MISPMMAPKVIAVDLDGTLLGEQSELSDYSYDILTRLTQTCVVVIVTGRNLISVQEVFGARQIPTPYLICCQGALTYRVGSQIELMSKNIFDGPDDGACLKKLTAIGERAGCEVQQETGDGDSVIALYLFAKLPTLNAVVEQIQSFRGIDYFIMHNSFEDFDWLIITKPNVSKGAAVMNLLRAEKIQPAQIIALGDSINDVSMLEVADVKVAMANATPPVKAVCNTMAPDHRDDGAAHWLAKNVLNLP